MDENKTKTTGANRAAKTLDMLANNAAKRFTIFKSRS